MKNTMNTCALLLWMVAAGSCRESSQAQGNSTVPQPVRQKQAVAAIAAPQEQASALDSTKYSALMAHIHGSDSSGRWPVKQEMPRAGAVLPFKRVVSYYGNLYSKRMGALGEFPKREMLNRLQAEAARWTAADSLLPAVPALHYIAVTAQIDPGKGGTYRLRMPHHQIDTVLAWAKEINALVFIDIQVGQSTMQQEVPLFEKYLSLPNVHFGIDPEFSMKGGHRPGAAVGTVDAADINYVSEYLANLVRQYNLPPKILVVHRFTQGMVTNYKNIRLRPEVQVVMDMDGWGIRAKKVNTYKRFIYQEPVQFTGFKIFYKNDTEKSGAAKEMQPEDVLKLVPRPVYIQYQ